MKLGKQVLGFWILVLSLLGAQVFLALDSVKDDSIIQDEIHYIPAGYYHLTAFDYRLNPETPPLMKDLAAFPLLFLSLKAPSRDSLTYPFDEFFYGAGNSPDQILFWSRMPMVLLGSLLSLAVFFWSKRLYGPIAGLLALFLCAFNTLILAESRYVLTDVGMAFFYLVSTYVYLQWLQRRTSLSLAWAGSVLGLAFLTKFSAIVLIPLFVLLAGYTLWLDSRLDVTRIELIRSGWRAGKGLLGILGIASGVIFALYQLHTWNMQSEVQREWISHYFPSGTGYRDFLLEVSKVSKPATQYLMGLLFQLRGYLHGEGGGRLSYLMGEYSWSGWWYYFPVAFFVKTQVPLMLFALVAVLGRAPREPGLKLEQVGGLMAIAVYATVTIYSGLNLGIRYLLPIYPFLFIWASRAADLIDPRKKGVRWKTCVLGALVGWYAYGALSIHPHYLAYYNELAGGPSKGQWYLRDSDRGQDLKRLASFVETARIDEIAVSCFLCSKQQIIHYVPHAKIWGPEAPQRSPVFVFPDKPPVGYFAMSRLIATLGSFVVSWASKEHPRTLENGEVFLRLLSCLKGLKPIHTIGYAIDVYYLAQHSCNSPHGSSAPYGSRLNARAVLATSRIADSFGLR